jgi:hypothetical protein
VLLLVLDRDRLLGDRRQGRNRHRVARAL